MQRENSSSNSSLVCFITTVWPVSELHEKLFAIFLGILSPLTVTSNYLLILALQNTNQLNTHSNKFILVMSCCDFTIGLILQPALIVMFFLKESKTICYSISIINLTTVIMLKTSANLSILISIDRYLQVTKLNRYNIYMNGARMKASIGFCFVLGVFLSCLYVFDESSRILLGIVELSFLWFVYILYSLISRNLQKHLNNRNKMSEGHGGNVNTASAQNQTDPGPNSGSHLSAIKTIRLLQVTMLVLYTPFLVLSILWNYYHLHLQASPSRILNETCSWLQIELECNAWANACILIHGNRRCRRCLLSWIRNSARSIWNRNSVAAIAIGERRNLQVEEIQP